MARAPEFDAELLALKYWGGCGSVHHIKFWGSSIHYTEYIKPKVQRHYLCADLTVPNMGAGRCLGPEGNGVSLGEGGEVGPSPPGSKEDKQSVLNEGRDNMEKDKKKDQREESEPLLFRTRIM